MPATLLALWLLLAASRAVRAEPRAEEGPWR